MVLQGQQDTVAALRTENRQLAAVAAEIEMLRRDDVELKQLAQDAADLKNANESRARVATARAQDRRKQLENEIKQQDRLAQMEVERMNREGNKLVEEYKAISARDKDGSLTVEARAQADAAAKSKIEAIQAKQREVQSFIENVRRVLSLRAEELRGLPPDPTGSVNPPWSPLSVERRLELRRTVPSGDGLNNPSASAGDERVSVGLPQADGEGLISAYEHITGTKVTREPSLANVRGRIDFTTASTTKVETAQAMRAALRTQMHVVLEPTVDGGVVARYSPPR